MFKLDGGAQRLRFRILYQLGQIICVGACSGSEGEKLKISMEALGDKCNVNREISVERSARVILN